MSVGIFFFPHPVSIYLSLRNHFYFILPTRCLTSSVRVGLQPNLASKHYSHLATEIVQKLMHNSVRSLREAGNNNLFPLD